MMKLITLANSFSSRDLQGHSFKGQDLAGADFSHADIRGADFTNANLEGANFCYAKAGLQWRWKLGLFILVIFLSALASTAIAMDLYYSITNHSFWLNYKDFMDLTIAITNIIINVLFWSAMLRHGIQKALITLTYGLAICITLFFMFQYLRDIHDFPLLSMFKLRAIIALIAQGYNPTYISSFTISTIVCSVSVIAAIFSFSLTAFITQAIFRYQVKSIAIAATIIVPIFSNISSALNNLEDDSIYLQYSGYKVMGITFIVLLTLTIVLINDYIAKRVIEEDEKYTIIRQIGLSIISLGGTNFRNANLRDASFNYASLPSSKFTNANLIRTNWKNAQNLQWTNFNKTILINPAVRELLVTRDGANQSYIGANMRGANLIGSHLSDANLKEVDLSEALLQNTCLEGANLTKLQAVGTDFTNAKLTDAYGLGTWKVDSTTTLNWVDCKWVYLLEYPKPGTRDKERRPSSGQFGDGEFTKLFQEVIDTVDLIFSKGVDWKAFASTFKKVQVENEDIPLTVKSIDDKGDGVVVVKVSVPPEANKAKLHSQFATTYDELLQLKDQQINDYRLQNDNLMEVVNVLASREVQFSEFKSLISRPSVTGKLVIFKVGKGDFETGFPALLQISVDGEIPQIEVEGELPPFPELIQHYNRWKQAYENLGRSPQRHYRIKVPKNQKTNVSPLEDCQKLAATFKESFNSWLNAPSWRSLKDTLHRNLDTREEIRVILQISNPILGQLPWQLWDVFENYRQAEVALSPPEYEKPKISRDNPLRTQVRILAILGNSTGIDIGKDREMLAALPQADPTFLVEPKRREVDEQLWDDRGWDILFFAGHSSSQGEKSCLAINQTDIIEVGQIYQALIAAVERGLKLAIFNSCDGLGLARELAELRIPQVIVMREPVPDAIAEQFLQYFLQAFAKGRSLYLSVREAREKLAAVEDKYPCASWLPVICQHPAEIPLTWNQLRGVDAVELKNRQLLELVAKLGEAIASCGDFHPDDKANALEQIQVLANVAKTPTSEFGNAQARKAIIFLKGAIASLPATANGRSEAENLLNAISRGD